MLFLWGLVMHADESISPRTGQLILSHTDLAMPAGPLNMAIQRTFRNNQNEEWLLGKNWRMNWEKRLTDAGLIVMIAEADKNVYFTKDKNNGEFLSGLGDRIVFDEKGTAVRTRLDGTNEK